MKVCASDPQAGLFTEIKHGVHLRRAVIGLIFKPAYKEPLLLNSIAYFDRNRVSAIIIMEVLGLWYYSLWHGRSWGPIALESKWFTTSFLLVSCTISEKVHIRADRHAQVKDMKDIVHSGHYPRVHLGDDTRRVLNRNLFERIEKIGTVELSQIGESQFQWDMLPRDSLE